MRFRHPQAPGPYVGIHNAIAFGIACPQQASKLAIPNGFPQATLDYLKLTGVGGSSTIIDGEDCEEAMWRLRTTTQRTMLMIVVGLTINVVTPANATPSSNLPVVVVCIL